MHVLVIPSWYPSSAGDIAGSFFREQAIALKEQGCTVGVIYPELRSLRHWRTIPSRRYGMTVENDLGIPTFRSHSMNWFPRTVSLASRLFMAHAHRLYLSYVKANGAPDVIHAHSLLYAGCAAASIRGRYGVPFVVTEHSSAFGRQLLGARSMSLARAASLRASHRLAVSRPLATLLDERLESGVSSWKHVPNIVNSAFLEYQVRPRSDTSCFQFVNVALMNGNKKQCNIIRAFARLRKSTNRNVSLVLVGDGPERPYLEKLTAELELAQHIQFTGLLPREDVMHTVAAADAFVLASDYETFCLAVVEALALGRPVISTLCGGPDSIVRPQDGILVPIDSVDALATAMRRVMIDRDSYQPSEIRASCAARYGAAAVSRQLQATYSQAASERG